MITKDSDRIAFAIWLFPKTIEQDAPERRAFADMLQPILTSSDHAEAAVAASLLYDLPVDLKDVDVNVVIKVCKDYDVPRRFHAAGKIDILLSRLARSAVLRLLAVSQMDFAQLLGKDIWTVLNLPVELYYGEANEEGSAANDASFRIVPPGWMQVRLPGQARLPLDENTANTVELIETYCRTIFAALQAPFDANLHLTARTLQGNLPNTPNWSLSVDAVLGQSPK
jgi:hypothetical protein